MLNWVISGDIRRILFFFYKSVNNRQEISINNTILPVLMKQGRTVLKAGDWGQVDDWIFWLLGNNILENFILFEKTTKYNLLKGSILCSSGPVKVKHG